jgi:hypothetical protein
VINVVAASLTVDGKVVGRDSVEAILR